MRPWTALAFAACLLLVAEPPLAAPSPTAPPPAEAPAAPTENASVLARLPHDPEAFTQGFLFHQGAFFESTGLYGQSSLRRVDPATGRVLARRELPARFFGEGLALCPEPQGKGSGRLVQLTWREGVILLWDAASLRPKGSRPLRGQGWGLACNGHELVLSDGSPTLRHLNARSLAETGRRLHVRDGGAPVQRLNELERVNGWILANVWEEDRIAVIRPAGRNAGAVALWIDLGGLRRELSGRAEAANGLAFDPGGDDGQGGRGVLYVTGKRWESVFALRLPELLRRPPSPAQ